MRSGDIGRVKEGCTRAQTMVKAIRQDPGATAPIGVWLHRDLPLLSRSSPRRSPLRNNRELLARQEEEP
jgi:hypothetical protein